MTIRWKAVEQYFNLVLFVFQFYPVCNLGNFIIFGLGTVRSERVVMLVEDQGPVSRTCRKLFEPEKAFQKP